MCDAAAEWLNRMSQAEHEAWEQRVLRPARRPEQAGEEEEAGATSPSEARASQVSAMTDVFSATVQPHRCSALTIRAACQRQLGLEQVKAATAAAARDAELARRARDARHAEMEAMMQARSRPPPRRRRRRCETTASDL